jgi:hypothetical protein
MAQEQETIKKNSPWLGIGAVLAAIGKPVNKLNTINKFFIFFTIT